MYKSFKLVRRYTGQTDYDGFATRESAIEFAKNTNLAKKEGMEMHWPRPSLSDICRDENGYYIDDTVNESQING